MFFVVVHMCCVLLGGDYYMHWGPKLLRFCFKDFDHSDGVIVNDLRQLKAVSLRCVNIEIYWKLYASGVLRVPWFARFA